MSAIAWRDLIDQLLFDGLLREDPNDGRPLIGLGDADGVKAIYRGERQVSLRKPQEPEPKARTSGRRKGQSGAALAVSAHDQPVFEALRAWRRDEAARQHLPPYVIFHDRTLAEIAGRKPSDLTSLGAISGVGEGKLQRYGEAVLAVLRGMDA